MTPEEQFNNWKKGMDAATGKETSPALDSILQASETSPIDPTKSVGDYQREVDSRIDAAYPAPPVEVSHAEELAGRRAAVQAASAPKSLATESGSAGKAGQAAASTVFGPPEGGLGLLGEAASVGVGVAATEIGIRGIEYAGDLVKSPQGSIQDYLTASGTPGKDYAADAMSQAVLSALRRAGNVPSRMGG